MRISSHPLYVVVLNVMPDPSEAKSVPQNPKYPVKRPFQDSLLNCAAARDDVCGFVHAKILLSWETTGVRRRRVVSRYVSSDIIFGYFRGVDVVPIANIFMFLLFVTLDDIFLCNRM